MKKCDYPDNMARGGIAVYHKSSLPIIFKPELTELSETLYFSNLIPNYVKP